MVQSDTQAVMIDAWGNKQSALNFLAAISARSALSSDDYNILRDVVTSKYSPQLAAAGQTPSPAQEIAAAVISGANLSLGTRKRILVAMGNKVAGNDLINNIQSVPQSTPTTL